MLLGRRFGTGASARTSAFTSLTARATPQQGGRALTLAQQAERRMRLWTGSHCLKMRDPMQENHREENE
jgi:hypothetical protein